MGVKRRAGELLAATIRHEGGRPEKLSQLGTVSDLGINRHDSSRWQLIASVPEERFERHIAEQLAAGRESSGR